MASFTRQPAPAQRPTLLFIACGALLFASPHARAEEPAAAVGVAGAGPAAAKPAVSDELSLRQLVQAVRSGNRAIQAKRLDRDIASAAIDRARGAFEPTLNASTTLAHERQRSTWGRER